MIEQVKDELKKIADVRLMDFKVVKTSGFTVEIGIKDKDYKLHFYLKNKSINPTVAIRLFIGTLQKVIPDHIHISIGWFLELNSYWVEFKGVAQWPGMDILIEGRAIEALKGTFK